MLQFKKKQGYIQNQQEIGFNRIIFKNTFLLQTYGINWKVNNSMSMDFRVLFIQNFKVYLQKYIQKNYLSKIREKMLLNG